MKENTEYLLRETLLTGMFLCTLMLAGCSTGDSSGSAQVDTPTTPPPVIPVSVQVAIYGSSVVEGADDLEFVVSLSAPGSETISLDYATEDDTAIAGADYTAVSGSLQFAPGEVRKFISVPVLNNTVLSTGNSKSMRLVLTNPQNAGLSQSTATGTIVDSHAMSDDSVFNHNWGTAGVFSEAAECAACHEADNSIMRFDNPEVTLSTNDISASTQWKHSVMANSFNDPYWQAAVQDESSSFPTLAGFIEDTCTTCHAPMGRTHAHQANTGLDANGHFRFDTATTQAHSREGVSCTLCHLMQEGGTFSGGYNISDTATDIFGPYANPRQGPMQQQTALGYTPVDSTYIETSAFCASCHTLYTPAVDPDTGQPSGPDTGLASADKGFLEQGPYLEWQNSVYSVSGGPQEAQCQDCHMPVPSDSYETAISTMGNVDNRSPYAQHTLVGGNAHLLEILNQYRAELGIDGSTTTDGFDDQIALTRHFLGGAASIAVSPSATVGDTLEFNVEVSNNAGHKIPSAYPSRRTWLHVTVTDSDGKVIFDSGKPDARGYISTDEARLKADCMAKDKFDGFDSSLCYEPHRDVVDDPSQVAIYETVLGDINGNITHTLLQGAQYLKDNRIPPVGFTNDKAAMIETQTMPSGVDSDGNFNCVTTAEGCGKDTVLYRVNIDGQSGPYTVQAELLYQATQPAFVDGMHTNGDRVNRFKVMYDAVPPSVEVLATATN